MLKVTMIKYRYAFDSHNSVIDVETLEREGVSHSVTFHCISCEKKLIPALGLKNRKHFRHQDEGNCSPETYLHKLGKKIFYEKYNECLESNTPFVIVLPEVRVCTACKDELGISCDQKINSEYDLTTWFKKIEFEQRTDNFTPDLLLSSASGERIFVEIAVTHTASEEKIRSGIRVIEVLIQSEYDLSIIRSCHLTTSQPVRFLNFRKTKTGNYQSECKTKQPFFAIYKNQKTMIVWENVQIMKRRIASNEFVLVKHLSEGGPETYYRELEGAYTNGIKIINCFLCRYHGKNFYRYDDGMPIFCKYKKKRINSNEAVNCEAYKPDPGVFPTKNVM